ncbi:oligopeptide ABC transporter permease [Calidifontibacillus erzurumensis]|uniref:ABC transporter permease n=1 Tax=Calidifontibacillus erzurumensis TaxID=2741433 RepID=A0A8J8GGM9_9BACI|nr:oligopeptide ABC transporter permease [Calidifontibacillus erzurumensis]NSL51466.1 ABC transporter permease [Calidifontibacillus erzurumensis]
MFRYFLKRMIYMFVTFWLIVTVTFFLMHTLPGSPFNDEKLGEEQIEMLKERYGLDQPVVIQYVRYLANIVQGDFGISFQYDGRPVTTIIGERLLASVLLGSQALLIGTVVGLLLGIIAAIYHHTALDLASMVLAVLGLSIPSFVFASILQYWLSVKWKLFPAAFWEGYEYTILPTISLAVFVIAQVARFIRTEMLEVLEEDYILTAKAKGLSNKAIIFKHMLPNAIIPVVTILGPMAVNIITGSLVIEKIFAIPGLGEQFVLSIMTNDYPVIMATTLLYGALFIIIILIIDLLYGLIDPRIRLSGGKEE